MFGFTSAFIRIRSIINLFPVATNFRSFVSISEAYSSRFVGFHFYSCFGYAVRTAHTRRTRWTVKFSRFFSSRAFHDISILLLSPIQLPASIVNVPYPAILSLASSVSESETLTSIFASRTFETYKPIGESRLSREKAIDER